MDIIHRLFRQKQSIKTTVWGIRVPEKVKMRWLFLSAAMRVPTNRLILFVLQDWVRQNSDLLMNDTERNRLADHITELYLQDKLG